MKGIKGVKGASNTSKKCNKNTKSSKDPLASKDNSSGSQVHQTQSKQCEKQPSIKCFTVGCTKQSFVTSPEYIMADPRDHRMKTRKHSRKEEEVQVEEQEHESNFESDADTDTHSAILPCP